MHFAASGFVFHLLFQQVPHSCRSPEEKRGEDQEATQSDRTQYRRRAQAQFVQPGRGPATGVESSQNVDRARVGSGSNPCRAPPATATPSGHRPCSPDPSPCWASPHPAPAPSPCPNFTHPWPDPHPPTRDCTMSSPPAASEAPPVCPTCLDPITHATSPRYALALWPGCRHPYHLACLARSRARIPNPVCALCRTPWPVHEDDNLSHACNTAARGSVPRPHRSLPG